MNIALVFVYLSYTLSYDTIEKTSLFYHLDILSTK